jgi:hypothetical protein
MDAGRRSDDSYSPRRHWCSMFKPDGEAWVRGLLAYRRVMTLVSSNDDLDWEFAFDSRLGHPTGTRGSQWRKRNGVRIAILHPDAAGIDVGASELFVAVSADRDHQPVRSFPTFTRDLNALADWLQQCGVCSVALKTFCYSR